MNSNHVGALYPDSFGNVLIGTTSAPVGLGSTGQSNNASKSASCSRRHNHCECGG